MQDTHRFQVLRLDASEAREIDDEVVVEEPLEIRVNQDSLGVTMRTPGDDFDLAAGFLWTEGLITSADEIGTMAYCPDEDDPDLRNQLNVGLVDSGRRFASSRRAWMSSSCGLCGKATLESIRRKVGTNSSVMSVEPGVLLELPGAMRSRQTNFSRTGGIHAAALFDSSGKLILIREDLGRHNAVDKVLGSALRRRLDLRDAILMVSGRLGFEIAQKAAAGGIPIIASVSAPSSLAIELAVEFGITAVGFVREQSMNVYSHTQRIRNGISKHIA